jgi:hypothetical protein
LTITKNAKIFKELLAEDIPKLLIEQIRRQIVLYFKQLGYAGEDKE